VYVGVGAMLTFHLLSQATLKISFLPHVLCIMAFLPLEQAGRVAVRAGDGRPLRRTTLSQPAGGT
jgi:hypothetical protein